LFLGAKLDDWKMASRLVRGNSLDAVAWGWMVPDLISAFLPLRPFLGEINRGWALEQTWTKRLWREKRVGNQNTLVSWGLRARQRNGGPAFLFNATLVEKGSPLVFGTTLFGERPENQGFFEFYGHKLDLPVTTAARLSATFPYVAPAPAPRLYEAGLPVAAVEARSQLDGKLFHVVDGGYYNNYGVMTLLSWCERAFGGGSLPVQARQKRLVVIRIESFPDTVSTARSTPKGGVYQVIAPLLAFLNVRDMAQKEPSDHLLRNFVRRMKQDRDVSVLSVKIQYPSGLKGCTAPPLSWKLTAAQQDCLDQGWRALWPEPTNPDGVRNADLKRLIEEWKN
jgi:hypothetical protein